MRHVALPLGLLLMALPLLLAPVCGPKKSVETQRCERIQEGAVAEAGEVARHDERVLSIDECARALREAEPAKHRDPCATCHVALAATEASEPGAPEVAVEVAADVGPLHRDVVPEEGGPWDTLDRPNWDVRIEGPGAERMGPVEVTIEEAPGFACVVRSRRTDFDGSLVVGCSHPGGALRQGVQTVGTLRFARPAEPITIRPSTLYYSHSHSRICPGYQRPIIGTHRWSDRDLAYYARDCRIKDREPEGASPVEVFDFLDAEIAGGS